MARIYAWEKCYQGVLDEKDPDKIPERLLVAEKTLLNRVLELDRMPTRQSVNELAWLQKAVQRLALIQARTLQVVKGKSKAAEV